MNTKTTVKIDTFGELYLVCTFEKNYLCNTSLEMLQKAFEQVRLNAKTVKSDKTLEIIINLKSSSVDLNVLKTLSEAVLAIIASTHEFQVAQKMYQERLSALAKDLYAVSKPTTSTTEESSCKGQ